MTGTVELHQDSSFEHSLDSQHRSGSNESGLTLPNVFVTPPEEEFDSPPWCCFDADKDAQPGAFVPEDFENGDFDYAAHAEEEIFGGDVEQGGNVPREGEEIRENVFAMRSLVQEAENLKEKLKSLELSPASFSSSTPSPPVENEELASEPSSTPTTTAFPATQVEEKVNRRRSIFSFNTLRRKKSREEDSMLSMYESNHTSGNQLSSNRDADAVSINSACSTSNKTGFFSRFKLSSKKSNTTLSEGASKARKSTSAYRSCEELTTSQENDAVLKRRFSIFELPRRRTSISQQPAIPAVSASPTTSPSMNQSNSSLSSSSIPLTPDAATCALGSPTGKSTNGEMLSFLSSIEMHGINNIAASLTFPSSNTIVPGSQFSLDPLHFESLQFNSDDFA
ncbi:uncharacterized protein FOMMEDRAFT_157278 [Fomitiporia mediterranea MF3/22]|uniref:uncharacterized protein n=1 Tax=Fomitiporia mediterranea (strain MF3/22) TaxID=694068 RepID=UPI0004407868|nr:uncharacterized protein FOMMEDRAFT_157278 [Fomitiporia mediterranea MF3/22]EJD02083.1 hypothetical protein FOMMEDRAFT_157278 [Fomitiporia mediterranea MF3/22]